MWCSFKPSYVVTARSRNNPVGGTGLLRVLTNPDHSDHAELNPKLL